MHKSHNYLQNQLFNVKLRSLNLSVSNQKYTFSIFHGQSLSSDIIVKGQKSSLEHPLRQNSSGGSVQLGRKKIERQKLLTVIMSPAYIANGSFFFSPAKIKVIRYLLLNRNHQVHKVKTSSPSIPILYAAEGAAGEIRMSFASNAALKLFRIKVLT